MVASKVCLYLLCLGFLSLGDKVFTGGQVFTGGDRSNQRNYETRKVPEMKMLVPYESAKKFSSQVQQALRNIKSGCYERSLEFAEAPISKEPPTYDEVMKK